MTAEEPIEPRQRVGCFSTGAFSIISLPTRDFDLIVIIGSEVASAGRNNFSINLLTYWPTFKATSVPVKYFKGVVAFGE